MFRLLVFALVALAVSVSHAAATKPNIIYILCDDLGYGDVKCLNPAGKIATPHLDRLAAGGMIFTDAHSGSSVCTPTRYGILTGRYAWRSRLKHGVLGGLSPRLIEEGRLTVAALLKQHGYATACIGKWHLGFDWVKKSGGQVSELSIETPAQVGSVDYSQPFTNGPLAVGFDSYFGISASLDMVPYVFLENDRVAQLPTETRKIEMMTGRGGSFTREGPAAPGFTGYEVLPTFTDRAVASVKEHAAAAKGGKPFFLYLPLASPHTPILPTAEWLGKSGLNPYADFVMQTDWSIGQVMEAVEKAGIADDTMIVVTSDNGCSPQAKFDELLPKGHNPNHVFRGHKADIFDGGHRVPFIVRWPARVKAGGTSDQVVCLTDLMATAAEIVGAKLPDNAGEDSVSFLPALAGTATAPIREAIVHHSINGSFSIRQGSWKLALCADSGGWSEPRPGKAAEGSPSVQLYDLSSDIGEKNNVIAANPEVATRLTTLLERYVEEGRSTPGARQRNTTPVSLTPAPAKPRKR